MKIIDPIKYTNYLSTYKAKTLNNILISCGFPSYSKKSENISSIINGLKLFHENKLIYDKIKCKKLTILSIDIGIKNFSYCKSINDITINGNRNGNRNGNGNGNGGSKINLNNWFNINLINEFPFESITNDLNSMINTKKHLSHLSNSIINEIILQDPIPQIISIEVQRTRSNGKNSTLPTILLNYTLENMIYSSFHTHQILEKKELKKNLDSSLIIPVNSRNLVNFWINRFINKSSIKFNASLTKKLRYQLIINNLKNLNFLSFENLNIPPNFEKLTTIQKLNFFKKNLSVKDKNNEDNDKPSKIIKIDDLIDSLLYNLMFYQNLSNQYQLIQCIENNHDLLPEVDNWNKFNLNLLKDIIIDHDLIINDEYIHLLDD